MRNCLGLQSHPYFVEELLQVQVHHGLPASRRISIMHKSLVPGLCTTLWALYGLEGADRNLYGRRAALGSDFGKIRQFMPPLALG